MPGTTSAAPPGYSDGSDHPRLAHAVEVGLLAWERLLSTPQPAPDDRRDLQRLDEEGRHAHACLVMSNLGLVTLLAQRIRAPAVPFADLVQDGVVGLMQAIMRWDHRRGFAFSTYAAYWIRQTMLRGLADELHPIRIPPDLASSLAEMSWTQARLAQQHGREPRAREVARSMGVAVDRLAAAAALAARPAPLDANGADVDRCNPQPAAPDEQVARRLLPVYLRDALAVLTERDATLVRLRFGLEDGIWRSYDEVAQQVGLTRERVRILVTRALAQVRDGPHGAGLKSFLG
jgi:RNA polymerase sigma factor (sigma-70 family)